MGSFSKTRGLWVILVMTKNSIKERTREATLYLVQYWMTRPI